MEDMVLLGATGPDLIEFAQQLLEVKEVWLVQNYDLLTEDNSTWVFDDEMSAISHVGGIVSNEYKSLGGIYRMDLSKHPMQVEELVPSLDELQLVLNPKGAR